MSISHTRIPVPRLPTDTGLDPDAARAVLADVAKLSEAARKTEEVVAALAEVISRRQKQGFYGLGGGVGVIALVVWNWVIAPAYSSYTSLQETVAKQGKRLDKMQQSVETNNKSMQAQQDAQNTLYLLVAGARSVPIEIDATTAPTPPVSPMRRTP